MSENSAARYGHGPTRQGRPEALTRPGRTLLLATALVVAAVGCTSAPKPASDEEKVLYALGARLGRGLVPFGLSPRELAVVAAGLTDGASGRAPQADKEMMDSIDALMVRRGSERAADAARNGPALVDEALRQPGAVKLPSGVVFRELVAGSGEPVVESGKVKAHLRGTLGDGRVIDDTRERGVPMVLPVNEVMPCWSDAIKRMKVGGKATVVCPPATAYGDFGKPPIVPPNATVTFEIEIVDAKP